MLKRVVDTSWSVKESRYRQRLHKMRAYQEEQDLCSSFPWRQFAQSWKADAGYQSMVIFIAEDAGQCVLEMDSSSSKSISVSSDEIRLSMRRKAVKEVKAYRNVEDGMWRWTCSTDVVCSALMKLRMSCRETMDRNSVNLCSEELNWIFLL